LFKLYLFCLNKINIFVLINNNIQLKKVAVIGSGFSGLAAACFLAQAGNDVTVFEKNDALGGRARSFATNGFMFDMGPSWYWMPDVFESFFNAFGKSTADYYKLEQLNPGFQMLFGKNDTVPLPAQLEDIYTLFESIEIGSAAKLKTFLKESEFKYKVGMQQFVYKPSYSWLEYANKDVVKGLANLHMLKPMSKYVRSFFKNERLIALMEFPVLFLGAMPNNIPALYSLMNYSAIAQGTWYPQGGMVQIINAMVALATELGVKFETNCNVTQIEIDGNNVHALSTSKGKFVADGLIASADYNHVEQQLLPASYRNYSAEYWAKKTFAPSSLIFYLGVNKKIKNLIHHNLFFDTSLNEHAVEIYENPKWPTNPLFYVCCPSKTDDAVAPNGMENLFVLIPIATNLEDTEAIRQKYYAMVMQRMEHICGEAIAEHVVYNKSFCVQDFVQEYNSYKGNAYGLANTLAQTGPLKPSMRNKKIKNMFYTGQLTVPGPGVPPSLISGQIAAKELIKSMTK
jgi:phytoene desaturase